MAKAKATKSGSANTVEKAKGGKTAATYAVSTTDAATVADVEAADALPASAKSRNNPIPIGAIAAIATPATQAAIAANEATLKAIDDKIDPVAIGKTVTDAIGLALAANRLQQSADRMHVVAEAAMVGARKDATKLAGVVTRSSNAALHKAFGTFTNTRDVAIGKPKRAATLTAKARAKKKAATGK